MAPDPWRFRCPKGHASVEDNTGDRYRCTSCGCYYRGEPFDAAETEFPVDDVERLPKVDKRAALRALYDAAGDTTTTYHASSLGERATAIGRALARLVDDGLVERVNRGDPARWRLTQRGYDKARPVTNLAARDAVLNAGVTDEMGMSPVSRHGDEVVVDD